MEKWLNSLSGREIFLGEKVFYYREDSEPGYNFIIENKDLEEFSNRIENSILYFTQEGMSNILWKHNCKSYQLGYRFDGWTNVYMQPDYQEISLKDKNEIRIFLINKILSNGK